MYNPFMRKESYDRLCNIIENSVDKITENYYYLVFHPFENDLTRVKYKITEAQYNAYKKLVEDYKYNPFCQVPVVINSSTGLFDNYCSYTTSSSDFTF